MCVYASAVDMFSIAAGGDLWTWFSDLRGSNRATDKVAIFVQE